MTEKFSGTGSITEGEVLSIVTHILNANFDTEKKLTESITALAETMTQVRISMGSMQAELKNHSDVIQRMSDTIEQMRNTSAAILSLQNQMTDHEKSGLDSRKRLNERIDHTNNDVSEVKKRVDTLDVKVKNVDEKAKIDLITVLKNLFLYVFGGSGLLALLFWFFENVVNK